MKRDIKCSLCTDAMRKPKRSFEHHGEGVTIVPGIALRDYRCDLCNTEIVRGALCWGVSIWGDRNPYFHWEHDAITIITTQEADAMRDTIERLSKAQPSTGYDG